MTCYQCEDAELASLKEEYEIMREDNKRLRDIISRCAAAAGAHCASDCTIDFLEHVPDEIVLTINKRNG